MSRYEEKCFQVCCFVRIPRRLCRRLRIAILVPTVKESTGGSQYGSVNKFLLSEPVTKDFHVSKFLFMGAGDEGAGVNPPGVRSGCSPPIVLEAGDEGKYFQACWFVRIPRRLCRRLRIAILVPTVKESTGGSQYGSVNKFFYGSR